MLKFCQNWCESEKVTSNQSRVHPHGKPEIRIFLRKRLAKNLEQTDPSEISREHLEHIDTSSFKILCNLVEWLTRYK